MSIMTIKLSRSEGTPWGFRLQGGKDFATPLCVQKVNAGSVAAVAGLQAGDAIVSIGGKDALSLRHKEAQEAIVRAGNIFDVVIQRGAQTWRPQVTPLAQVKTTPEGVPVATSTSLAANKKPVRHIGSNHNTVARPFPGFTGATPTYSSGSTIIRSPLSNSSEEVACSSLSGTSSRSTSGSTSPSGLQQTASPNISLNKEIAKNFLRMTLDKENVNTVNVHQTSRGGSSISTKSSNSSSSENLFSGAFSPASGPAHQRKYSLASNASSSSSEADHDALTRRNNEFGAPVGAKHNAMARPFAEVKVLPCGVNGQQIVNAQYNTPLNLYSEDNIAETLSAQAEVLGKGCLGVNFMKNERAYDPKASDVLRMVQEMDSNPVPEPEESPAGIAGPAPALTGHRSVRAPETKVRAPGEPSPLQATKCSECERPITGVFVRIKNKSLHADCFKCATCGSSLKNVGYYNINEKLYCDVHAKQAARHHPPGPNLDPIIVKPGATAPAGAIHAPFAKTAAPEPVVAAPEPPPAPEPQPVLPPEPEVVAAPEPEPVPAQPEPVVTPPPPPPVMSPPPAPAPVPEQEVEVAPAPTLIEAQPELMFQPEPEAEPEPEPEPEPAPEAPATEAPAEETPLQPPTDQEPDPQTSEAITEPQPEINGSVLPESELTGAVEPADQPTEVTTEAEEAPQAAQEPEVVPESQAEPQPEITEVAEAVPLLAPEPAIAPEAQVPPQSSEPSEPTVEESPGAPVSEPEPTSGASEATSVPVSEPAPILAPAPAPIQVPAAPMAAPPPIFSPVKAPAAPAPQKAPFGAPAGGVDVRSHIPKKGGPFLWPPPKKVESGEEGPRTPSWAPAGEPVNVPKPKYIGGPLPKRPPLLPTPPPPKDYDSIVIKASPSAATQPSADPKAHPLAFASAFAPAHAPAPAPAPAPARKLPASPEASKAPRPTVNASTPTAKPAITKPVTSKPAASKPITGFKPVAAPKAGPKAPSYGFKPVSSPGQKNGPALGAPSLLAFTPIPPPAPVPIVNSNPAPAPKPPAAAFASVPKPAAPKPPAPTGPAPVFAPAPAPELPKPSPLPNLGGTPMKGVAQTSGQKPAPRRGRGVMNPSNTARIPICADCNRQIRGPFVSALGKTWCPDHFVCSTASCRKALIDMGFVEEQGALHCEDCYEKYLAPICGKCDKRVKGDCLNAVGKQFHPECFCCAYCGKVFGSGAFYLEDGLPYCETDWNDLFTTKCVGCGFPIEAGDRWVEALNNNYHSQCFKCSKCHKNLEGQSFFAKGGKPFCKAHAQRGL